MSEELSFEEWAEQHLGLPTHKIASGDYQSFGMACAVKAWNARAQPVASGGELEVVAYLDRFGNFRMQSSDSDTPLVRQSDALAERAADKARIAELEAALKLCRFDSLNMSLEDMLKVSDALAKGDPK